MLLMHNLLGLTVNYILGLGPGPSENRESHLLGLMTALYPPSIVGPCEESQRPTMEGGGRDVITEGNMILCLAKEQGPIERCSLEVNPARSPDSNCITTALSQISL